MSTPVFPDFAKYEVKLQVKVSLLSASETPEDIIISLESTQLPIAPKEFAVGPDQSRIATKLLPMTVTPATLSKLLNGLISVRAKSGNAPLLTTSLAPLFFGEATVASEAANVAVSVTPAPETPVVKEGIFGENVLFMIDIRKIEVPIDYTCYMHIGKEIKILLNSSNLPLKYIHVVEEKSKNDFALGNSLVFAIEQISITTHKSGIVKFSDLCFTPSIKFDEEFFPAERTARPKSPEIDVGLHFRTKVKADGGGGVEPLKARVKGGVRVGSEVKSAVGRVAESRIYRVAYVVEGERAKDIEEMMEKTNGFVIRYNKPSRVVFVAESAEKSVVETIAEKLLYERNDSGKVLYHPQCYWTEPLYQGVRSIRIRRGVPSLEMIDFFLANSIFQLRDKFPTKEMLDELETLKGEAPSLSPIKKRKLSKQEIAEKITQKIKKLQNAEIFRDRDVGREFESRLRANALDAPFNVVNGTYVPRLAESTGLVKVSFADALIDRVPAPWRHLGKAGESIEFVGQDDFIRYFRDGRGSRVDLTSKDTEKRGHVDLWR